jgi:hypothetical protein
MGLAIKGIQARNIIAIFAAVVILGAIAARVRDSEHERTILILRVRCPTWTRSGTRHGKPLTVCG